MDTIIKTSRKEGIILTVGNYKGGAGKTSNSTLIGYTLAKMGVKVLVVDLDPQTNATKSLLLTKSALEKDQIMTINKTIMSGVANGSFTDLPVNIMPNYDLLPSYPDFGDFSKYVYKHANTEIEEVSVLKPLLDDLRPKYDLIILDIPPMSREVTANATIASDYTLISFQTQERSLTGAENYINDLLNYKDKYNLDIDVVGILPVLQNKKGTVDNAMLNMAKDIFGESLVFDSVIPHMERIKRFDITGITDRDRFDKKVMQTYRTATDEFIERINVLEENKNE
ncbi:ParA family protein [Fructobacillus sp. M158]|uniref:ParA family protein n=1 Tax=Fructobacillus parabroussonetiae TaxID=2713174 RepID=UPI00200B0E8C|nr:ParA family protein [Fructobacillus parabroussonetiae]MCK8617991.1 ParA family protein [Fructobacillus parabroussonetiae]